MLVHKADHIVNDSRHRPSISLLSHDSKLALARSVQALVAQTALQLTATNRPCVRRALQQSYLNAHQSERETWTLVQLWCPASRRLVITEIGTDRVAVPSTPTTGAPHPHVIEDKCEELASDIPVTDASIRRREHHFRPKYGSVVPLVDDRGCVDTLFTWGRS